MRKAIQFLKPGTILLVALDGRGDKGSLSAHRIREGVLHLGDGAARLAARCGASLIPVGARRTREGSFEINFGDTVDNRLLQEKSYSEATRPLLDFLWPQVQADPEIVTVVLMDAFHPRDPKALHGEREDTSVRYHGIGQLRSGSQHPWFVEERPKRCLANQSPKHIRTTLFVPVCIAPDPMLSDPDRYHLRGADRTAFLALAAARDAWNEAHLEDIPRERIGLVIGTSRGPVGANLAMANDPVRPSRALHTAFSSIAGTAPSTAFPASATPFKKRSTHVVNPSLLKALGPSRA